MSWDGCIWPYVLRVRTRKMKGRLNMSSLWGTWQQREECTWRMRLEYSSKENWWCSIREAHEMLESFLDALQAIVGNNVNGRNSIRNHIRAEQHSLVRRTIWNTSSLSPPVPFPWWVLRYGATIQPHTSAGGPVFWWGWRAKPPNSWLLDSKALMQV